MGTQSGETVYISEVNRAMKVKSNAQVVTNKNSDPVQKVFPKGGRSPKSSFFQTSEIV